MRAKSEPIPTVPVAEFGPSFMTNADLQAWARLHGVELRTDYLGRPALSLVDAYKVADANEKAQAEAERRAELVSMTANAQRARERLYEETMTGYVKARHATPQVLTEARAAAWKAVKESERELPREVRDRLTGVNPMFMPVV